ncbi:unnamed protein product [Diamesa hyperborea]
MNSQNALSQMSLVAQRYLKKLDQSSVNEASNCNVIKSTHDLFLSKMRSEFSPDVSCLSSVYDIQNNTKLPDDQYLWEDKCSFEAELKKRKVEDSFLEANELKNDTMCTERLFGNDTISSDYMMHIQTKLLRDSQPNQHHYQVEETINNSFNDKKLNISSHDLFSSPMRSEFSPDVSCLSSVYDDQSNNKLPDDQSLWEDNQPISNQYQNQMKEQVDYSFNNKKLPKMSDYRSKLRKPYLKPKKLEESVLKVGSNIDESIFNKSIQCIDNTIVAQNCDLDAIEMSVIMDEKLNLNSSYKTRKLFNSNSHLIRQYYKVTTPQNWNSLVESSPEMIEPSLEYIEYNLKKKEYIDFGAAKEDIEIVFSDCTEIEESMQELEESFTNPEEFVCSTPTKDLVLPENGLLEIPRTDPLVQEVGEENIRINTKSETTEIHFETSECGALESNTNIQCLSLARCVDIAEENALNSLNIAVNHQDDDDLQLISQLVCPIAPEIEHQELSDPRRTDIKNQIEKLIYSLLQSLVYQKPMIMKVKNKSSWNDCTIKNNILSQREANQKFKSISLTNKNSERYFTVVLHILCEIYKLLSQNSTCTKRELYYRDVELLQNMGTVERALNDISLLFNVQPWELGVFSSSKGLVAGNLRIINANNVLDFTNAPGSVPHDTSEIIRFETNAKFVLVVEKDTVFQRLVDDKVFQKIDASIILITAKGYPDVNTRLLLKKMSLMLKIPIYILVDADPHGIEIMCTYKYGSLAMSHNSENLAVPSMVWLGILPSEIDRLDITTIAMTKRDEKKATEMLKRPYINPVLKSELQILLNRQVKAEIEGIYHFSINYMINEYLPNKIRATESLRAEPFKISSVPRNCIM